MKKHPSLLYLMRVRVSWDEVRLNNWRDCQTEHWNRRLRDAVPRLPALAIISPIAVDGVHTEVSQCLHAIR
jgi:hypothetical protein